MNRQLLDCERLDEIVLAVLEFTARLVKGLHVSVRLDNAGRKDNLQISVHKLVSYIAKV